MEYICEYKTRVKQEYTDLITRLDRLKQILEDEQNGLIEIKPQLLELLKIQALYMGGYAGVLRDRCALEGIDLN